MYALIYDANLEGGVEFEDFDTPDELAEILESKRGVWWHDFPTGAMLLDNPTAWVYRVKPDPDDYDPYPDFIIGRGPSEDGGLT